MTADIDVDFNEVFDDDYVWAVLRDPFSYDLNSPAVGQWVRLTDFDGATCQAIVLSRGQRTIECKIDWTTWQDIRFTPERTDANKEDFETMLFGGRGAPEVRVTQVSVP